MLLIGNIRSLIVNVGVRQHLWRATRTLRPVISVSRGLSVSRCYPVTPGACPTVVPLTLRSARRDWAMRNRCAVRVSVAAGLALVAEPRSVRYDDFDLGLPD